MSDEYFTFATTAIEAAFIAIGLIGNLLSIIVFSRKTFRNNSISTYCIALSIVECLTLVQFINDISYLKYKVYLMNQSEVFCKIVYTNSISTSSIQPWIIVVFSVDKLLSMRTRSIDILKKKWFQWSLVAAIFLFHIAFYIYVPILLKLGEIFPGYFICDLSTMGFFNIYMIINMLDSIAIPFIIMLVSSILTIRKLFKSRISIERSGKLGTERRSRDHKYAISSIIFNAMFIVLKLPTSIIFTSFAFSSYYNMYLYSISVLLFHLNLSLSFFIHFMTNSLFRREFWGLFRFSRRNNGRIFHLTTVPIIRINQVSTYY